MKRRFPVLPALCLAGVLGFLGACGEETAFFRDGYYTAEAARFDDYGWKEYVTLGVSNGRIITVEYNARNPSGFIKSWDMDYMRRMNAIDGTYPNEYVRYYAEQLLLKQNAEAVDALSGATISYYSFKKLAAEALLSAKAGDSSVVLVAVDAPED